jgi:hypothetical protein
VIKDSVVYVKEVFAARMLQLSLQGCIYGVFCNKTIEALSTGNEQAVVKDICLSYQIKRTKKK